jgi:hypothetical protein
MGTDPKPTVRRSIIFSEDQAIDLLQRMLRTGQDFPRRLASQGSKKELLLLVDLDDMEYGLAA